MAFTYGFYNSIDGDRKYDAQQMSAIFDGIITDGVFSSVGGIFATVPGDGLTVVVKSGRAWFDHTWSYNDGSLPLAIETPDVTLQRYDAVVLEVNNTETVRENAIKIVKGTAASTPTKPTLTDTDDVHQHPLAYILVKPGATSISTTDIDIRVGQTDCPFATAILETVSISDLYEAWNTEFQAWFEDVQTQLEGDIATNLLNEINKRVKIADKATSDDIANATSDKWVDAAGLKESVNNIYSHDSNLAFEYITSSTTWTAPISGNVYVIAVGGGGGGGAASRGTSGVSHPGAGGGGGGSGHITMGAASVTAGTSYAITVGAGGAAQTNGGSSSALGIVAEGGSAGGDASTTRAGDGGYGGAGGGGGCGSSYLLVPGGNGGDGSFGGGGGGGCYGYTSASSTSTNSNYGGSGGNGGPYGGGGGVGASYSSSFVKATPGLGGNYGGDGATGGNYSGAGTLIVFDLLCRAVGCTYCISQGVINSSSSGYSHYSSAGGSGCGALGEYTTGSYPYTYGGGGGGGIGYVGDYGLFSSSTALFIGGGGANGDRNNNGYSYGGKGGIGLLARLISATGSSFGYNSYGSGGSGAYSRSYSSSVELGTPDSGSSGIVILGYVKE